MRELKFAFRQTLPILFEFIFIGLSFGIMMSELGYSPLWSMASGVFIYAGSIQLIMVSLLKAGAPLAAVALTCFAVNARHIFYGIGFIEKFRKMGVLYPYMVFALPDETYSVLCSMKLEEGLDENRSMFLVSLLNHVYWSAACFIGGMVGSVIPWDMTGIDFSCTVFFMVVVVNQWQQYKSKAPALTGLICAFAAILLFGSDTFLIPALSAALIILIIMRDRLDGRLIEK